MDRVTAWARGYRTLIVNFALAVLPVMEVLAPILSMPELQDLLPPEWLPWYAFGVALINVYMRWITTTPVGKKA